jgi:hypothetical protein
VFFSSSRYREFALFSGVSRDREKVTGVMRAGRFAPSPDSASICGSGAHDHKGHAPTSLRERITVHNEPPK